MSDTETNEALIARLTDERSPVRASTEPLTGAAASEAGRAFLLGKCGSDAAIEEADRVAGA
ncbi:hypothetical protein ITJ57_17880 [Plantibacter sp. VKM Ac-2880]|uniref:hypothetical protein n=1 Tax=Plantibacter sp. VKM Ac-2880 TaxID=2783827 RepID=UPI00188E1DE3|nr:hypothetical protein [Plantibacter sp. VKM Ac-2880]MBF4570639.1 hypothetical protein [Plantibacter sp. VKM Ac-2880]